MNAPRPSIIVDTRGLFCPIPIIKTSEAIGRVDAGGIVEVISDDPGIEHDLPAWCRSHGHRIERMTRDGKDFHYLVKKV